MSQPESEPTFVKSWPRDYFESICIAVIFALFIRTFVVQAFKIPSKSMEDNLLVGDHLLVDKFGFAPHPPALAGILPYRAPEHGDVVVFKYPKDPQRDFIKRAIGVGGDRIEVRRGDGQVFRNGEALAEPYAVHKLPEEYAAKGFDLGAVRRFEPYQEPITIRPGELFAMGDNRLNSEDSRVWGTVPPANIKGRALLIYWSFDVPRELQVYETKTNPTAAERGKVLRYTLIHFLTRTRWSRTFRIVR